MHNVTEEIVAGLWLFKVMEILRKCDWNSMYADCAQYINCGLILVQEWPTQNNWHKLMHNDQIHIRSNIIVYCH